MSQRAYIEVRLIRLYAAVQRHTKSIDEHNDASAFALLVDCEDEIDKLEHELYELDN